MEANSMQLYIPEGAHVHIVVGQRPDLPLVDEANHAPPASGIGRPLLLGGLALTVILGGLAVLRQFPDQSDSAIRPVLAIPHPNPLREPRTFPEPALPRLSGNATATTDGPGQVPQPFTDQLRQAPTVEPPPGRPAVTPDSQAVNPFGLHE
jgi:hypothetical protein